jgi:hypothetical protein
MSVPIIFTTLAPRTGYVEIELESGERVYEATPEQQEREANDARVAELIQAQAQQAEILNILVSGATEETEA